MPHLRLDLCSPVVDLTVQWAKEGRLPDFELFGSTDVRIDLFAEDVHKKQELGPQDFGGLEGLGLDLGGRGLSESQVFELARRLPQDASLATLRFCDSPLGDAGVRSLVHGLQRSVEVTSLKALDLSGTGIGDGICEDLAKLLEISTTLRQLDLSRNRIGCSGAGLLAAGLRSNDFLQELNLNRNAIADHGAAWLAKALEINPYVLEKLDISDNSVGEVGVRHLEAAFEANCSLAELRLGPADVFTKTPTAAVGMEGQPPQPQPPSLGEQFVVRCHRGGAEIRGARESSCTPSNTLVGQEKLLALTLLNFEQDAKDLDLVFAAPALRRDGPPLAVHALTKLLRIELDGQAISEIELFGEVDPFSCDWSTRDGVLEVSLTKARPGELWPGLAAK